MLYRCHSVIVKENDKTKSVHVQCGDHFFSEYFQFMLVESMDVVPINTEGQLPFSLGTPNTPLMLFILKIQLQNEQQQILSSELSNFKK
jgi:hypothetical protein